MKKALIFGINGQDGSFLSEYLLSLNYEVFGGIRRASIINTERINELNVKLYYCDLADYGSIFRIVPETMPDEIYNLRAMSFVKASFEMPLYTADIDGLGTLRILEAIRLINPKIKFYQASTSELYGKVVETPQDEYTSFYPRSPYGVAKLFAYWSTVNYRESYGIFACNGILFNHESSRRGHEFVSKKIVSTAVKIKYGIADKLVLGNIDSKRDFGYAKDYVEAMYLMMQEENPGDYVIATGQTHTIREFIECTFRQIGIIIFWKGEGLNEVGYDSKTGNILIIIDKEFYRPAEVDLLLGNSTKALKQLKWQSKTSFNELIKIMVKDELQLYEKNK